MSPRTQQQNLAIQEESKNKIVVAALELFAENGYQGTSIRQIAESAGIAQGLLYNYFQSKDHLLVEIMERGMGLAQRAFVGISQDEPPLEQLETLVQQIFVELQKQVAFWRVFYSLRNLPAFNAILGDDIIQWTNMLRDVFQGYYQQAGVPNPEQPAWVLYALVEGIIQQYLLFGDKYPLSDVVNEAVRLHCRSDR